MSDSPDFREKLERNQVWIYAASLLVGAVAGLAIPGADSVFEGAIYPVLGILLYVTLLQVPFTELKGSITSGRFLAAVLVLNFVFVPVVVFGLTRFVAAEPALLLGVLLVLLTPCIDYVVVFSELGGGDAGEVIAATPLLMISQIATLPVYLWLFVGSEALSIFSAGPFLEAFFILIAFPLGLAIGTQYLAGSGSTVGSLANRWVSFAGYLPVPFLAFTLLAVVASQIPRLEGALGQVVVVVPIYVVFLVIMAFVGRATVRLFSLGVASGRGLIFTGATRNSLVVLPLALALPAGYEIVPAIIITQTLVELAGMLVYVRMMPDWILPDPR